MLEPLLNAASETLTGKVRDCDRFGLGLPSGNHTSGGGLLGHLVPSCHHQQEPF